MTVKDLRVLVDNLDEYIRIPGGIERLKKTILHLAVSGQLVPQDPSEGTGEELYQQIQSEKKKLVAEGKIKNQKTLPEITDEEIPFAVPNSWKWVRLGEVGDYRKGPFGSSLTKAMFVPVGLDTVKVYEQKNAIQKDWQLGEYFISKSYYDNKMRGFKVGPSDIIVSCAGTIGEMYTIPEDAPEGIINQALMKVSLSTLMNKDYYLHTLDMALVSNMHHAMGSAIKNIPPFSILKSIPIPLPSFQEQIRIISKIERYFSLIEELRENYRSEETERRNLVVSSLAKLQSGESKIAFDHLVDTIKTREDTAELRKTILHLAVSGQLVPQDPSEGTGEEFYQQIQTEKKKLVADGRIKKQKPLPEITEAEIPFEIPESWKWVRLQELCWLDQGEKTINRELNNLDAKYLRGKKAGIKKSFGYLIKKNQRAILVDGENSGEVFVIPETGYLGSTFKKLVYTEYVEIKYLDFVLKNLKEEMRQNKIGAAIPHLDKKLFREKMTSMPCLSEQGRIVEKTTQLLSLVDQLESKLPKTKSKRGRPTR